MMRASLAALALAFGATLPSASEAACTDRSASLLWPDGYRLVDGRLAWPTIKACASALPGTWLAADGPWCRDMVAARLDGWRAAGGKGEPPDRGELPEAAR